MLPVPAFLTLFMLYLTLLSNAQQADDPLLKNLGGEYNLVDVKRILNITEDPAFLADICPTQLSLTTSAEPSEFVLRLGSDTGSSEDRCRLGSNSSIPMTFRRVRPDAESGADTQQVQPETIALQDINAFFPVFLASSPDFLVCPNRPDVFTQILAQDTGYWNTLANHYKSSGDPLGSPFNETDAANLNVIRGMYALNLAVDFENGVGCTYLKELEEANLRMKVNEILEPSPTPKPSSGESNESTCFPSDTRVELADGSFVSMKELKVGDMVRDASGSTSKVLLFTHAEPRVKSEFVIIHTSTTKVALSATHYIYKGDELLPAAAIKVGDEVTIVKRRSGNSMGARVVKVEREILSGLYNPQTASGSIVVSWRGEGVLASTYTTAVPPMTAHAFLGPLRFLGVCFDVTIPQLSLFFKSGARGKGLITSILLDKMAYPTSSLGKLPLGTSLRTWSGGQI